MDTHFMFPLRGSINSSRNDTNIDEIDACRENQDKNNILCVIWKSNKIGAAYFSLTDSLMYVYEEYVDPGPHFLILKYLYQEILPKYTICVGSSTDIFIKELIDTINNRDSDTTASDIRSLPPNFFILSMKEYPYEICKSILQHVDVASYQYQESSDALKTMYIHSLINFDYKMSVYAAGSLIKYLDKNWALFSPEREVQIMYIHQVTLKNNVLIDWNSFNAFQIFQQKSHEAGFKRGVQSNTREGMSIYKLFSSHCKSRIGQQCLRKLLLNPTFDITELNKRLDFIQFVLNPIHREFIESIQDNIKQLVDVNIILRKVQNTQAKSSSWETLLKTIQHTIIINELSGPLRHKSELYLNSIIPFLSSRVTIRFGIDADLDAKKMQRQDISKNVTAAARVAVEELPEYLSECVVVYLPEVGHLVSIKEWEPNCDPEQLSDIGYKFMFTVGGCIHYKTPLCVELDETFGDINAEIIAHENRLIQRMSSFVLKYNKDIREPLKLLAFIDSLIALAKASEEKSFVKPILNDNKIQEIKGGRHPLIEEMFPGFVSNDFYSGGRHSHIKIITGANGSGKSIYLKQIGIIIYLAHIGSYVPAQSANIGVVHSIHFRTATESVSVRLSAFMLDVAQVN
ncbi:hypothetical protein WA026_012185 [Henosepilachna vigintioctopunctata]|uniref:DNA mismatch repair protein MutS core domain-containing protein n=1 Tax=Henosepilachna vigintioctopunctata TaxID=420089 RepID=A0AAW1V6D6_9CUCU